LPDKIIQIIDMAEKASLARPEVFRHAPALYRRISRFARLTPDAYDEDIAFVVIYCHGPRRLEQKSHRLG